MKRIVYTQPNGALAVVVPVINTHTPWTNGEAVAIPESISEEQALERAIRKLPNYAKENYIIVDESQIPDDRTFRNAWAACPVHGCRVDMAKARELHRENLRRLRRPKMEALDVEYMRADEAGDNAKKAEVRAKKQALRDVTQDPSIEAAQTPEDLKAVLPDVLHG